MQTHTIKLKKGHEILCDSIIYIVKQNISIDINGLMSEFSCTVRLKDGTKVDYFKTNMPDILYSLYNQGILTKRYMKSKSIYILNDKGAI